MNSSIPKLYSNDFAQNTHEYFARLRKQRPVCPARLTRFKKAYLITKYEDVVSLLRDDRVVKNPENAKTRSGRSGNIWMPRSFRPLMRNMLNVDEPDHRRLRNLVQKVFTVQRVAKLQPRLEEIAGRLLDDMEQRLHRGKTVDLVSAIALPLPATVIAEMIGVPEQDRAQIHKMTQRLMVVPNPWNMLRAVPSILSYIKETRKLAAKRRDDPQDDLMTALVNAEEEGDRFTEDELVAMVFLLTVAGHETTVGLISNGVYALLTHPEQMRKLQDNENLVESAVEELLRFDGPLSTTELAFAKTEIEVRGEIIPQGAIILPAILSANRDEDVFLEADKLDITRDPNKHLAFGHGIHYCLGAPLARLETALTINFLLRRFPSMRLAGTPDDICYSNRYISHRIASLPVRI